MYIEVARSFGLKVSIKKTKLMVVGQAVQIEDKAPLKVGDNEVECVWSSSPTWAPSYLPTD